MIMSFAIKSFYSSNSLKGRDNYMNNQEETEKRNYEQKIDNELVVNFVA